MDGSPEKAIESQTSLLATKTYFKNDLGFSYKVADANSKGINVALSFANIEDYTSKDYIQFAFKDTTDILAKNTNPGKHLDGKTFNIKVEDLIEQSE